MKMDRGRIQRFLMEIRKSCLDLENLITKNKILPNSIELKASKYLLIELAEAIANTLQHILAKERGIPVSGYIDTIVKAYHQQIISQELYNKLKPFFDFRNSLIHRYWSIDDSLLIDNLTSGYKDFFIFIDEIERYMAQVESHDNQSGANNNSKD